jgi:glycosyl hydrolase family 76
MRRCLGGHGRATLGLLLAVFTLGIPVVASSASATTPAISLPATRPAALSSVQATYLTMAENGVAATHAWWNKKLGWYIERLGDTARYPLASIWDSVPLFEGLDEIAMASPTAAHISAVKSFARYAQNYWNQDLKPGAGFAPYPGDKSAKQETWFDDNGWWGLALVDAYQVTKTAADLTYAEKAFHFIQNEGWDSKHGGLWWTTTHAQGCGDAANKCPEWHSGEALGAATDLAARLYQATHQKYYLNWALKFIFWANSNILDLHNPHYYSKADLADAGLPGNARTNGRMPEDGEGAMLSAMVTLCDTGLSGTLWCVAASNLAGNLWRWMPTLDTPSGPGGALNAGPQYDTILLRGFTDLVAYDEAHHADPTLWYDFITTNADLITPSPANSNRYPLNWNGSASIPGWPAGTTGQLQTQAANASVFADLARIAP